jgi:hypothetical protein
MSNGCPERAEWLDLLDGEATENRASVLRAHAAGCPACARELELQRRLIADLAAPVDVAPGAVEAIMRQLPHARPVRPRSRRWALAGGALILAAVAGIVLVPRLARDPGTFTPRGADKVPWTQKVGAELFVLGESLVKLEAGAQVAPGVALVASYHNVDRVPAYLMVFARDSQGELHWIYPGFADAKSDPPSVRLLPLQTRQVLPDSVALDDLPAGTLELISLITREPLRISQFESLPPGERNPASLRTRFTDARIASVSLQVVAPAPNPTPPRAQVRAPSKARSSTPAQTKTSKPRPPRAGSDPRDWMPAIDPIPASKEGL